MHNENSDQTGRMPRLIWVFAGRTLILLVLSFHGSFALLPYGWEQGELLSPIKGFSMLDDSYLLLKLKLHDDPNSDWSGQTIDPEQTAPIAV